MNKVCLLLFAISNYKNKENEYFLFPRGIKLGPYYGNDITAKRLATMYFIGQCSCPIFVIFINWCPIQTLLIVASHRAHINRKILRIEIFTKNNKFCDDAGEKLIYWKIRCKFFFNFRF